MCGTCRCGRVFGSSYVANAYLAASGVITVVVFGVYGSATGTWGLSSQVRVGCDTCRCDRVYVAVVVLRGVRLCDGYPGVVVAGMCALGAARVGVAECMTPQTVDSGGYDDTAGVHAAGCLDRSADLDVHQVSHAYAARVSPLPTAAAVPGASGQRRPGASGQRRATSYSTTCHWLPHTAACVPLALPAPRRPGARAPSTASGM